MKKLKIFSILLLVLGVFACTDLDENPLSKLSPDGFVKSPKDVETIIFGAYGRMANNYFWGRKLSTTIMLRSDMVDIGNPGTPSRRIQVNNFTMDPANGMISAFWPVSFEIISAANTAIAGAESLGSIDEVKRNELIGEAKFIRAFTYFILVRMFGDIPYVGEAVSDPLSLIDLPKTPASEVYANIIADLEFAKQYAPMTLNARSRGTKGAAATMLADVYLTMGNWSEAYKNAKWVIDNAGSLEYGLEPNYQDLFDATKQDNMEEHIFAIDFKGLVRHTDGDDLFGPMTGIRGADMQGWGVMVPSMEVYDSFDKDDYRTDVAFFAEALVGGVLTGYEDYPLEKRPHIAKFRRFPGEAQSSGRQSDNNYAMYRYAEVLLIAAEAGNELSGPSPELEGYVNQIRQRARNADGVVSAVPADVASGLSQDDFREMVLEERRIELAFEAKRWFDIQRRRLGSKVFFGENSLEPHDNFDDNNYLFPIPQFALDVSPSLEPQNPGY